jgi:RNA polymerase sigma factor (sigma-70 family)
LTAIDGGVVYYRDRFSPTDMRVGIRSMDTSTWPSFLDLFDSDPDRAFEEFYLLASEVLHVQPPRPMLGLSHEDRQDLAHDIIYHCVKDDFRVLRSYRDQGKPFTVWFYPIAHNKTLDFIRSRGRKPETTSIHEDVDGKGLENVLSNPKDNTGSRIELADLLNAVRKAVASLSDYCRMLIEMAADEFTPKEMAQVLRLPADQNKKVSDDLRYCREKLRKRLSTGGIDIG